MHKEKLPGIKGEAVNQHLMLIQNFAPVAEAWASQIRENRLGASRPRPILVERFQTIKLHQLGWGETGIRPGSRRSRSSPIRSCRLSTGAIRLSRLPGGRGRAGFARHGRHAGLSRCRLGSRRKLDISYNETGRRPAGCRPAVAPYGERPRCFCMFPQA
jgi:hypothetical protein